MPRRLELVTSSRCAAFAACARLHDIQYVQGYRPRAVDERLAFGAVFGKGLDAWWGAWRESGGDGAGDAALAAAQQTLSETGAGLLDEVAMAKAHVLMAGYHLRWAADMADYEVIGIEIEFRAPIYSPTGRRLYGVQMAGKLDKLVRQRSDGSVWIVEHKTSAADLSAGSSYWQRLRMDRQVSMYFDGAERAGFEAAGCIYDVVSKLEQRPYKATPPDKRQYTKDGRLYAKQREVDETIEEFTQRLVEDVGANPDEYFHRAEVVRLDSEIEASRRDVYEMALLMRAAKTGGLAPRNSNACHSMYGRPCPFTDVCSGAASLDDDTRFEKLEFVHPELSVNGQ